MSIARARSFRVHSMSSRIFAIYVQKRATFYRSALMPFLQEPTWDSSFRYQRLLNIHSGMFRLLIFGLPWIPFIFACF